MDPVRGRDQNNKNSMKKADQTEKNSSLAEAKGSSRSASNGMEATIYNGKGKAQGKVTLPESVFAVPWNADMVHQVVTSMLMDARTPVAHAKTRGEVRGGGRKPWRQKGTGRARHGSIRSPLWRGGGVATGPTKLRNFSRKVNRTMKVKALYTILSKKHKDGELLFVDSLAFANPKTKEAKEILLSLSSVGGFEKLASKKKNAAVIGIPAKNAAVEKSFRNMGNISVEEVRNFNPLTLLNTKYVVLAEPEKSVALLASRM